MMEEVFEYPRSAIDARNAEMNALREENERLKESLRKIGEYETLDGEKYVSYEQGWYGVAEYARKALNGDKK